MKLRLVAVYEPSMLMSKVFLLKDGKIDKTYALPSDISTFPESVVDLAYKLNIFDINISDSIFEPMIEEYNAFKYQNAKKLNLMHLYE